MSEVLQRRALALASAMRDLHTRGRACALVGGLAVSARAEPRFTRDIDIAVVVRDDADAERLVLALAGYHPVATVEHEVVHRLSTVRLRAPDGASIVDLLFASTGIEAEIVERASVLEIPFAGLVRVAELEELLAMKVLSMRADRPHDRTDALGLLDTPVDLDVVREHLSTITARGYHREQDLHAKLAALLAEHAAR